jgi:hypothetical protein
MHDRLINRLYTALDRHDHQTMASCYHDAATFRDIAFDLSGKMQLHAMWHMICLTDIRASFQILESPPTTALVSLIDDYTYSKSGRHVHNQIESRFQFAGGLIIHHVDDCDPRKWAAMALGPVWGFIPGRIRLLRSLKARSLLRAFIRQHPQYDEPPVLKRRI